MQTSKQNKNRPILLGFLKNTTNIFLVVFSTVNFVISLSNLNSYYITNTNSKSVDYTFLSSEIQKGGRGRSHIMKVFYDNNRYDVDITEKNYYNIKANKMPILFHSEELDLVYSKWGIKKFLRTFLVFGSFSIIGFGVFVKRFFDFRSNRNLS